MVSKDAQGRDVPVVRYNGAEDKKDIKSRWWLQPEKEMHQHVFPIVKGIREQQAYRTTNNLRFARLYANMDLIGLQAGLFARVTDPSAFLTARMSYNVVAACIDTASSKIGKNKTRPLFLTDGGKWEEQRRAQNLTAFMEASFDTMGTGSGDNRSLYGVGRRAFVDGGVFGTGVVKFFPDQATNSVKAERILIEELVIDETEGMYEMPRQIHQEKLVHREVLMDMFPKHEAQIAAAQSGLEGTSWQSSSDMIKVIESWHLPSKGDKSDGRKAICIENCTLDVGPWKKDYFPFLFKRWKPRVLGFYGSGIAEELVGIQLEINKMLRTAAIVHHLTAVPQIWLDMANKANAKQIDNEIGGVKYYLNQPPIFHKGTMLPPEFYGQLENFYRKAFEIVGISQLSAASVKPSGLDSKVALREYQDIESERFALVQQRDQEFYIDAAHMTADMMDDLKNPSVRIVKDGVTKELNWKDVKMDLKKTVIRAFPTDILPSQPAGKLNKVQELTQGGFFEKDEAFELLDFPDLKAATGLKLSSRRNIKRILEKIIDTKEYISPEPYTNLQLAKTLAQAYYEQGQIDDMPEDRLDLIRRYMDDVQALIETQSATVEGQATNAAGAAQVAAADSGAGTLGQPAPQPVSPLLPIAQ